MQWLVDPGIWASFISLTALEIVLGIDNVVFIALVVQHLKSEERQCARTLGLSLALILRFIMLFGVVWIIGLKEPLYWGISGKDALMLIGGLFLIYKATDSIHNEMTGDKADELKSYSGGFVSTIIQILLIDLIFSFDSVITAVGITEHIWVIVAAMTIAMLVMLLASSWIARFIEEHPTLKMLALAFVMLIGVFLVAEGFQLHVPKAYIYFSMAFSLGVELLNMKRRGKKQKQAS